jgi:hypothetical protein
MKSEDEIWTELQKVRARISDLAGNGRPVSPMLTGMEQALGWTLDRLRPPSEAEHLIRQQHEHRKLPRVGR